MTILRTDRTIVDYINSDDAAFFVRLANSPGWLKYIGDRSISDVGDARLYLENVFMQCYRDNGFGYYVVKTHEHLPLGICGFLKKPELDNPDFGFALLPDYYGQGFAYESSNAVFEYGIRTFGFTVLDAVVSPDNQRSIRLLEKLAFSRYGNVREDMGYDSLLLYRWRIKT